MDAERPARSPHAPDQPRRVHECALCGARFEAGPGSCRPACPMAGGCAVVCCPSCGYQFPAEDVGLAGLLRRLIDRTGRRR